MTTHLRVSLRAAFVVAAAILVLPSALRAQATATDTPTTGTSAGPDPVVTPPSSSPEHETLAPRATASRIAVDVEVDGVLDEAIWSQLPAITEFRQRDPNEGQPATLRTEVRIAYDDEAIYIGARMYDDPAGGIVGRLARRDADTGSDFILDPVRSLSITTTATRRSPLNAERHALGWRQRRHLRGTGVGGRGEIDSQGWTAEMRIPFSQLRFHPGSTANWGLPDRALHQPAERDRDLFVLEDERSGRPVALGPHRRHRHAVEGARPARAAALRRDAVAQMHGDFNEADPFASEHEATFARRHGPQVPGHVRH